MNAMTATRPITTRMRTLLTITVAAALLLTGQLGAQANDLAPGGEGVGPPPDDAPLPIPIPLPPLQVEPTITIGLVPTCAPSPGVQYVIDVHDPYPGQHLYEAHWAVDQPLLFPQTVANPAGFVPTGEGDFVFRGQAENVGQLGWFGQTDWTKVTVDCSEDGGGNGNGGGNGDDDEDDNDGDPEDGGPGGDDDIVDGDPNFTG